MTEPAEKAADPLAQLASVDKLVHEPARLRILGILSLLKEADFLFLLNQTGMTKGNLSTHLRRLEDAGYISIDKSIVNRTTRTVLKLSLQGRRSLKLYQEQMKEILGELA